MGSKKKVGSQRSVYKKRRHVGKQTVDNVDTQTPRPSSDSTNLPTVEGSKPSSSRGKLQNNLSYYDNKSDSLQYSLIDLDKLNSIISDVAVCKICHGTLCLDKKSIAGLACNIRLSCSICNLDKSFDNCDKISFANTDTNNNITLYDLNIRLVYGLRVIGKGHTAAKVLCGILNVPPPPTTYTRYEKFLGQKTEELCEKSMLLATEEAVIANENCRDLSVALDGSWHKRGHVSLNGTVSLTSIDTGKVLDIYCMSKHCLCPNRSKNIHSANCTANYIGTSGGMEAAGAVQMFQRSMERGNVRYVEYLGDGDSNGHKAVCEANPYGEEVEVAKLECVGHVQKRMGTRLRTLKAKKKGDKLSDGKPLSGKNRLTDAGIQKIQNFFGLAIRRNPGNLGEMKKAVWAVYYHILSNNDKPTHQLCPKGELSWCKYNKSRILNEDYNHNKHFHLPEPIMLEIKPIFQSLSNPDLLKKCLTGKSQNPNESLNNLIWTRIPKRTFVNLQILKFGTYEAVLSFNDGYVSKCKLLEHLGLKVGHHCIEAMKRQDFERIRQSDKAAMELEKKIRQQRTLAKRKLEDMYEAEEDPDNPSYGAGLH